MKELTMSVKIRFGPKVEVFLLRLMYNNKEDTVVK